MTFEGPCATEKTCRGDETDRSDHACYLESSILLPIMKLATQCNEELLLFWERQPEEQAGSLITCSQLVM